MTTKLPHWVKIAEDNVVEFYLDHTLLSSARMCESRFMLDHISCYKPKGTPWALDFGALMHLLFEYYHKQEMKSIKVEVQDFLTLASKLWRDGNFDKYANTPQYKAIGGFPGYIATLTQYFLFYTKPTSIKPIATEIAFGKNKEVPLLTDSTLYPWAPFRLYLSGRLDIIFDDGIRLGPMDHKTFSIAGKNPITSYEVQEGMTGYIYALRDIHKTHFTHLLNRTVDRVWMNFCLTKPEANLNIKFQRIPLIKQPNQLEEWRIRQISTTAKIYQMLFQGRPPDFNANVCTNYWYGTCHYQPVHRLARPEDQLVILQKDFKIEEWNPEEV